MEYFKNLHDFGCNQKYDSNEEKLPYSFHLNMVFNQAKKFKYLVMDKHEDFSSVKNTMTWELVTVGCYGHDSIEDARLTYNDLKIKYGQRCADIIYACTEYRGRNPDERHPPEYYKGLLEDDLFIFVKLCDVIANALYSVMTNNQGMGRKSKDRYYKKFKVLAYNDKFKDMYEYLEKVYTFID